MDGIGDVAACTDFGVLDEGYSLSEEVWCDRAALDEFCCDRILKVGCCEFGLGGGRHSRSGPSLSSALILCNAVNSLFLSKRIKIIKDN